MKDALIGPIHATLALLLLAGCGSTEPQPGVGPAAEAGPAAATGASPGEVRRWGTMREALREGDTKGRVELSASSISERTWGIGALAGLTGEITVVGGVVWISEPGPDGKVRTQRGEVAGRSATMLYLGEVEAWREHPVERDVPPAELDAFLGKLLADSGLDAKVPRVLSIEGPLTGLRMHVVAGECPIRARMLNQPVTRPAFVHEAAALSGTLVGVYQRGGTGDMTHMGSDTHLHVLFDLDGQKVTGHAEAVGLARGAVIRLPAK